MDDASAHELVVWNPRNRTDFASLQQRITAGRHLAQLVRDLPASFVVFDILLDADGVELMSRRCGNASPPYSPGPAGFDSVSTDDRRHAPLKHRVNRGD
jgi:hypothetical protein